FTLFNNGTVTLGRLMTSGAITLVNQPTGVFFIGDGTLTAGGGTSFTFNNLGFFHKASSPGTASITSGVFINGATVSNQTGTVDVGNGTLMFGLPVTSNCAVWKTLTAAASIVFTGPFTANPCTINTSPDLLTLRTTSLSKPAFINETITSMGGAGAITMSQNN